MFSPRDFARFVRDVTTGQDDLIVPADDLMALADAVGAATPHPSQISTLVAEFGRELAFPGRLEDVLTDWSA